MSDKDFIDAAGSPWIVTAGIAIYAFIARWVFMRQVKTNDSVDERLGKIETDLALIRGHFGIRRKEPPGWE